MNKFLCFAALTAMILITRPAKADSPVTSTYIATFYYEYPMVSTAETARSLTDEIAAYLLDPNNLIDVKAAVINAIGWNYDGTDNATLFKGYLAKYHGTTTEQLSLQSLTGDELFCLGYFMAMDNYFVVDDAINVLQMAAEKNKESFTTHLVLAMVEAQKSMDYDWCKVWRVTADVLNDKTLVRDMKTGAIQSIVDYMILYKGSCSE
jgi:hypothetical protein